VTEVSTPTVQECIGYGSLFNYANNLFAFNIKKNLIDALLSALEYYIICKDGHVMCAPSAFVYEHLAVARELFRNHLVRYLATLEPALSASQPFYIAIEAFETIFKTWLKQTGI
jgi:hypothetical protein